LADINNQAQPSLSRVVLSPRVASVETKLQMATASPDRINLIGLPAAVGSLWVFFQSIQSDATATLPEPQNVTKQFPVITFD
jgi:hypothetical protein